MMLSHSVDGVLLVVKAGSTAREVARRAVDIMEANDARILGVVLNNARNSLPYYYDYTHYHFNYKSTGSDGADPSEASSRQRKSIERDRSGRVDGVDTAPGGKRRAR
jgi:Mrp family chromosome partitioning ATPase